MKDRIVENPNRYLLEPVEGMEGVVDLIPFPGAVLEEGTPLNKATLLSDGTAAALGLTQADPTVDGALRAVGGALAGGVRIATGSYTGTGTYGQSHPNVLSFGFAPDVVFVFAGNYNLSKIDGSSGLSVFSESFICFLKGGSSVSVADLWTTGSTSRPVSKSMSYKMDSKSLSWYFDASSSSMGPLSQLNVSGTAYHYIAIGRGSAL